MSFTCPEGCKAYYGVNGDQLDLNAVQGTVDLKSGQKQVNIIFFFFHLSKMFIKQTYIFDICISACIHQRFMCNLWMPYEWWLLWVRGTNLEFREWRWLQNGFPYLCLSKERSIERRHQDQVPKSKGQTMLSKILHHYIIVTQWTWQNIGVSWTPIPTQPGAKDLSRELWEPILATTHDDQWHSFQTQWNRFGDGFWTILYWTRTNNIWVWVYFRTRLNSPYTFPLPKFLHWGQALP